MPSDDIVISVEDVSKHYRLFGHAGDRVKQFLSLGFKKYHREFQALHNVSFEVHRGESIGIIGRNGSGKSTLLQLICDINKPTAGQIRVNGKVSALLELGAGFNQDFTGRENVYFQGALMGFSRAQMERRFEHIAAFADIGEYIDQPVRTYSSGMFVRLAFSTAVHADPDVLVVDEALSVGDAAFQHRSARRIRELIAAGTTLLFVSHDRATVAGICDRCLLLDEGKLLMDGPPSEVFDYYTVLLADQGKGSSTTRTGDSGRLQIVSGSGEVAIESIRILAAGNERELESVDLNSDIILEFEVAVRKAVPRLVLGFTIRDVRGQAVFGVNTNRFGTSVDNPAPDTRFRFRFGIKAIMAAGSYSISTALVSSNDRLAGNYECRELARTFEVCNPGLPAFGGSVWLDVQHSAEALR